ncbi:hypothetical protein PFISCL1PPCAC_3925, partial [Pristionchus fissidentatus]
HSSFFNTLFHGDFMEKDQEEIELTDVSLKEFRAFLIALYCPFDKIEFEKIAGKYASRQVGKYALLVLGDRYEIPMIIDRMDEYLATNNRQLLTNRHALRQSLELADRYRLVKLQRECIYALHHSPIEIRKLKRTAEYSNFSDTTKASIERRLNRNYKILKEIDNESNDSHNSTNFANCGSLVVALSRGDIFQPLNCEIGGLRWYLYEDDEEFKDHSEYDDRFLSLHLVASRPYIEWSCEGTVDVKIIDRGDGNVIFHKKFSLSLDNKCPVRIMNRVLKKKRVWMKYGTADIVINISIGNVTGMRETPKFDFSSPSKLSDLVVNVDGKKIYVSRQYMSTVSSVFREILDEDPVEITLDNIDYKAFLEFLHCIYPSFKKSFTVETIDAIMDLSMRFNVEFLSNHLIHFVLDSSVYSFIPQKIVWGFEYDVDMKDTAAYNGMHAEKRQKMLEWMISVDDRR